MTIIFIQNYVSFHNEIVESIFLKYKQIINNYNIINPIFYLYIQDKHLINYLKNKYEYLNLSKPKRYDYFINCTLYENDIKTIINDNKHFYIAHEITEKLEKFNNVFFLTPLTKTNRYIYADILPFSNNKICNNIPIFVVQGNITSHRRNYNLLIKILENNYEHDFKIKMIGRGKLPTSLHKYKDKIILKNNLDFENYHKEFNDVYCVLTLITKKSHPIYYTNKLTSTINYAKGYNLKCLIDKDLQEIYKLKNVEIFNDENDISTAFEKMLIDFYI